MTSPQKENWEKQAEIGAKVHEILNSTIHRKLTIKEYQTVIERIDLLLSKQREEVKQQLEQKIRDLILPELGDEKRPFFGTSFARQHAIVHNQALYKVLAALEALL